MHKDTPHTHHFALVGDRLSDYWIGLRIRTFVPSSSISLVPLNCVSVTELQARVDCLKAELDELVRLATTEGGPLA